MFSFFYTHRKTVQVVLLVLFCTGFLVSQVWRIFRAAEISELRDLYSTASAGDAASISRIEERHSSASIETLEKLANNQNVLFAESRVMAIEALGRERPSSKVLLRLTWIGQPFVVRHAAADVLIRNGCDQECISSAVFAVRSMLDGEPTFEMQLVAEKGRTDQSQSIIAELRVKSENDYSALLNIDPCGARRVANSLHSNDANLSEWMRKNIRNCWNPSTS